MASSTLKLDTVLQSLKDRLPANLEYVKGNSGGFTGLVHQSQLWIVCGMRTSLSDGIMVLVSRWDTEMLFTEIHKGTNWTYNSNSGGTVQLLYNNATTGVISGAIRLY